MEITILLRNYSVKKKQTKIGLFFSSYLLDDSEVFVDSVVLDSEDFVDFVLDSDVLVLAVSIVNGVNTFLKASSVTFTFSSFNTLAIISFCRS